MFVNNEITNRGMVHRLLERVKDEVTMDERNSWARSVEVRSRTRSGLPSPCATASRARPSCLAPSRP